MLFLPLIWIAVRSGMNGAIVATGIVQLGVVLGIHREGQLSLSIIELQALVADLSDADIDRPVYLGGTLGMEWATVREVVDTLRANYCGNVGLEYMHIADVEERRFLQDRMEGKDKGVDFTPQGKKAILNKVIEAEQWEKFLGRKYVGTKRFGLDGGESMIPALESVIKYGGQYGVREIVYGMAHRGRLNVLANVMAKPYRVIFHEFSGGTANPEDVGGSGLYLLSDLASGVTGEVHHVD